MSTAQWEQLAASDSFRIRRRGRFVVVDLQGPHRVFSTSVRNGGQAEHVRCLVNHQSCEGAEHHQRHRAIAAQGQEAYHDAICAEIGVPAGETTLMGTAANMHYAAVVSERDEDVCVTAVVTAGVSSNATCAGDPANWRETAEGMKRVPVAAAVSESSAAGTSAAEPSADAAGALKGGTINIMLLVDRPLTAPALARAIVTMTEAKSAALQWLAVPSCQSGELATGTGTDQYCVAAPLNDDERERPAGASRPRTLTSTSPHVKLGEIIGRAVRGATLEALRWQNGLEASYTRGLFHALGRYGLKEHTIFDDLADLLPAEDLELLRKNSKAAFYEPLAGAAAHAMATVLDRTRHGTIPASASREAIVQQAALLAASLAAAPERCAEFRARLLEAAGDAAAATAGDLTAGESRTSAAGARAAGGPGGIPGAKALALAAIALGWREKWSTS